MSSSVQSSWLQIRGSRFRFRRLVAGFRGQPGFEPRSVPLGFVVEKGALEQVFFGYFSIFCRAFHQLFYTNHHSSSIIIGGWYNRAVVASVIVDSVPPHPPSKKNRTQRVHDRNEKNFIHLLEG
jgi:hypothetical protein